MRKIRLLSLFLLIQAGFQLQAQNRTLYGSNTLYDALYGNPARKHFTDSNTFISFSLPAFAGIGSDWDIRGALKNPLGDLIFGDRVVDTEPFRANPNLSSYLVTSTRYDAFMFKTVLSRKYNAELSFGIRANVEGNLDFRNELLEVFTGGNANYVGQTIDGFFNTNSVASATIQSTLGYRMNILPKLGVGVNTSIYKGLAYREARVTKSSFYTASKDSGAYWDIAAKGAIYEAGINNDFNNVPDALSKGNYGIGVTVGAEYELNNYFTLSGSVRDMGIMRYNSESRLYTLNKSIRFEGINLSDAENVRDSIFESYTKLITDTVENFKFYRNLNTSTQLAFSYRPTNWITFTINSEAYFFQPIVQFNGILDIRMGIFHILANGGIANNSYNHVGTEFLVRAKHADFYIGVEQMGIAMPRAFSPGINFNTGLAFRIGRKTEHEKQIRQMKKENPDDYDQDGVLNEVDKCPFVKGVSFNFGCPTNDQDNDGLVDSIDNCPQQQGPAENLGCPYTDRDGDGLLDKDDLCPDEAGDSTTNGCPPEPDFDKDDDGVADSLDLCPDQLGPIGNNGCPYEDKDNDGVFDNLDKCPEVAGTQANEGCPEPKKVELSPEEQAIINKVFTAISFAAGKATISTSSYKSLNVLADLLLKKPAYKLTVEGYTDNTGDEAANVKLSQDRADAVKQFLLTRGVEENRITATGYGASNPVADNSTSAGRVKNRRVEFTLFE